MRYVLKTFPRCARGFYYHILHDGDLGVNDNDGNQSYLVTKFCMRAILTRVATKARVSNAELSVVSTECLAARQVPRVQPFLPAHKWIVPQPRSSLPSCRGILPHHHPASLNRSRAGAPRGARGLILLRKTPRAERGAFLFCFFFSSCLLPFFYLFRDASSALQNNKNI